MENSRWHMPLPLSEYRQWAQFFSTSAPYMTATPPRSWTHQYIAPTDEQQQVLRSTASAIIVSALAGTGKTTTLCMKACNLIAERPQAPRVLVLAYSRAGVTAVRDRMLKLNGSVPRGLEVLTIEQICERVLKEQGDPVEKLDDPVRKRQLILQAQQALLQDWERGTDGDVRAWLAQDVDVDAFLAFEMLAKKKRLDKRLQDSDLGLQAFCQDMDLHYGLYRLYRQYERMRVGLDHEPRFYAEGDCTFEVCRQLDLLDWNQPYEWLHGRYDAVLFDELHDLDEGALTILRKLVQSGNGFFVGAGDFNQHIHEGALSVFGESMQHIKAYLPADTAVHQINTTRRFGSEICNALNPLFGVAFVPAPGLAGAFSRATYDSDGHCAQQLVDLHEQVVQGWGGLHGDKGKRSALNVILRNPRDSILLEWVFGHEGVHYGCQGMSHFYLRREVALTLALMWALQGSNGERNLTHGILSAAVEGLQHYSRRGRHTDPADLDVLAQSRFDDKDWQELPGTRQSRSIAATLHANVARMRSYIVRNTLDPDASSQNDACAEVLAMPQAVLDDAGAFCDHPMVRRIFVDAPINGKERQACMASLDSLASLARGIPVGEFLGRLALIAIRTIEMHQSEELITLRLLSIDACKGREFTFVAVPFVERGRFPGATAHEEAYRERNMLYVAMTRARTALWLLEGAKRPVGPGPV